MHNGLFIVFSVFDGISCAQVALNELTNSYQYYASEIDKNCIKVANYNFPHTIQLGDIRHINVFNFDKKIDLFIGGSPCQNLSRQANNSDGLHGEQSILFYEYVRLLKELQPRYFVFENVHSMTLKDREIITSILKVQPVIIDAALVSAQRRKRIFWTNIPGLKQPSDRNILLNSILNEGNPAAPDYYWNHNSSYTSIFSHNIKGGGFKVKSGNKQGYEIASVGDIVDCSFVTSKSKRSRVNTNKSPTLTLNEDNHFVVLPDGLRRLTVSEYEQLQSLPVGYTSCIKKTPAYDAIGNGFNVEVIKHILSFIPDLSPPTAITSGKSILQNYPGAKGGAGVIQQIINQVPAGIVTLIEGCAGSATLLRTIRPASTNIAIDIDTSVIDALKSFDMNHAHLIHYDIIKYLKQLKGKNLDNPTTLIYLDPPYPKGSRRGQRDLYNYEMKDCDHTALLDAALQLNCKVMLSTYENELYAEKLKTWRLVKFRTAHRGGSVNELLYCNYPAPEKLHDYRFTGNNFRKRERISRKAKRWYENLAKLPPVERNAIVNLLKEKSLI
jgi:DNA-cytosine methyltransferase